MSLRDDSRIISAGRSRHGGVFIARGAASAAVGVCVTFKDAFANIVSHAVPVRRLGTSFVARIVILVIGLAAMSAYTVPDLQKPARFSIEACLWCCLAYFAIESGMRARTAIRAGLAWRYLLSLSGLIDLIGVVAVPIALVCGVTPPTAWLLAS